MSTQPTRPRFRPSPEDIQPVTEDMMRQQRDHEWVLRDMDKVKQYTGQIVAVYRETIWGSGRDHGAVIDNAAANLRKAVGQPDVPSLDDLNYVVIPELFSEEVPLPVY